MAPLVDVSAGEDGVGLLRLDRPEARNALSPEVMETLAAELERFDPDPDVRCVVIAGSEKVFATESAVECANLAIQVHGGSGYVDDYPVERYLRDARVTTLYEGTSQIQKLIIGRAATGINALVP